MLTVDPEGLVFLDESGVSTQMTRRFARACGGRRVDEPTPEGNWKIVTVLGAMSLDGMIATMTVEAATGTEIFLAFLDRFLCPKLKPGRGSRVLDLPPYSPDLNTIGKAWSKLKQLLRSVKARTVAALEAALTGLIPKILPKDAKARFRLARPNSTPSDNPL
jgi:transposase